MSADPTDYMFVWLNPVAETDLHVLERRVARLAEDEDPLLAFDGPVDLGEIRATLGELRGGHKAHILIGATSDDPPELVPVDGDECEDAVTAVVRAIERLGASKNRGFEVTVTYGLDPDDEEDEEADDADDDDESGGWWGSGDESEDEDDDGCDAEDDDEDPGEDLDADDDDLDEDGDDPDDEAEEDPEEETEVSGRLVALVRAVRLARVAA